MLTRQARTLLDLKVIPYYIQAQLGDTGYITVEDLADRWHTAEEARVSGPKELKFEPNSNDYTAEFSKLCAMRLYQVVKLAKQSGGSSVALGADTTSIISGSKFSLDMACDRAQLEAQYQLKTKSLKPPLEEQGSDTFLKKQFRYCLRGEIGFFTSRQIISLLPEAEDRPVKRRKTLVQALEGDDEEESRANPTTMRQLQRLHTVFATNLLMCTFAFPQFSQLEVEKADIDDFYSWLHGPSIGGRSPAPSIYTLMMAERNAWREIARKMHLGKTLKASLQDIKQDLLFWQREVYEKLDHQLPQALKGKGYRQYPHSTQKGSYHYANFAKGSGKGQYNRQYQPSKGHDKGHDKGKGKKGKPSKGKPKGKESWPSNWAKETPRGVQFCMNYHLKGNCTNNPRNRSHNCPVMKDQGGTWWTCNAPPEQHTPSNCPNA